MAAVPNTEMYRKRSSYYPGTLHLSRTSTHPPPYHGVCAVTERLCIMSGFEVVGVLLGAIPLVISALEHYSEGVSTCSDRTSNKLS